jgi:hypothetical protein
VVQCAARRCDETSSFAGRMLLAVSAEMPIPGRCSGLEKLGTAVAWKACAVVRASRRCSGAAGLPDAACALARPRGIAQANWWLKPLYQGAACDLADGPFGSNETAFSPGGSLRAWREPGVVAGEMLRVLAGCVAGVKPDADPVQRITVNAGSVPGAPGCGGSRARCAVC